MKQHLNTLLTGLVVGAAAIILTWLGNPPNMGLCIACFIRDISGSLGFHRAAAVQYLRPEVAGLGIGALIIALVKGEHRVRGGANPVLRFVLGFVMMVGALIFLGCPLRMTLRLAAGDLNALVGLGGFIAGIFVGIIALKSGFNSGRSYPQLPGTGAIMPVVLVALMVALVTKPAFIFFSETGPGSLTAPILIALGFGLLVGILAQRSRLCMAGGIRDIILIKDPHLLYGFIGIFAAALVGSLATGTFKFGFEGQPIAHTMHLWNFVGMTIVGWAAVLAGGCPLRQLIMAGQGDSDALVSVIGMGAGAAVAHNFGLAGSGAGVAVNGQWAGVIALVILAAIAFGHKLNLAPAALKKAA